MVARLDALPDSTLVARLGAAAVRDDDVEAAFRALYDRHAPAVAGLVARLLGAGSGDVDDVVQETFLAARDGIGALRTPGAVRSWLCGIAVRRVLSLLRSRRRRRLLLATFSALGATCSDPRDREPIDELYGALADLPPELRVPWSLARIELLELAEVASACGVSLSTVKRRVALAEERIARRLT